MDRVENPKASKVVPLREVWALEKPQKTYLFATFSQALEGLSPWFFLI
jgi:hypothetical protein